MSIEVLLEQKKELNEVLDSFLLKPRPIEYAKQIMDIMPCYNCILKEYTEHLKEENSAHNKDKPKCD